MKLDIKVDSEMVEIVKSLKKAGCFFMLLTAERLKTGPCQFLCLTQHSIHGLAPSRRYGCLRNGRWGTVRGWSVRCL